MAAALSEMLVLIHYCAGKLFYTQKGGQNNRNTFVLAAGCTSSVLAQDALLMAAAPSCLWANGRA